MYRYLATALHKFVIVFDTPWRANDYSLFGDILFIFTMHMF